MIGSDWSKIQDRPKINNGFMFISGLMHPFVDMVNDVVAFVLLLPNISGYLSVESE